jgi:predicted PurR-regulated permease PerM
MKRWAGLILNLMGCVLIVLVLTIVMLADDQRADRALRRPVQAPTDAVQLIQWHGCAR